MHADHEQDQPAHDLVGHRDDEIDPQGGGEVELARRVGEDGVDADGHQGRLQGVRAEVVAGLDAARALDDEGDARTGEPGGEQQVRLHEQDPEHERDPGEGEREGLAAELGVEQRRLGAGEEGDEGGGQHGQREGHDGPGQCRRRRREPEDHRCRDDHGGGQEQGRAGGGPPARQDVRHGAAAHAGPAVPRRHGEASVPGPASTLAGSTSRHRILSPTGGWRRSGGPGASDDPWRPHR